MKLSIIIPVYNTEKYLDRCIGSVLEMKGIDKEIVMVDDGSTDSSPDIIRRYVSQNDSIKAVFQENRGASSARNNGIRASSGDYIYFLDSDDWIDDKSFGKTVMNLEEDWKKGEGPDILIGKEKTYSEYTGEEGLDDRIPEELKGRTVSGKEYLIRSIIGKYWNVRLPVHIYRSGLIKDNGIFFPEDRKSNEDEVFTIDVFYNASTVKIVDETFGYYRSRDGSIMSVLKIHHAEDIYKNIREILEKYRHEHDEGMKKVMFYKIKRYYNSSMKKAVQCGRMDVFEVIYKGFKEDFRKCLFSTKIKPFENTEFRIIYHMGGLYYKLGNSLRRIYKK